MRKSFKLEDLDCANCAAKMQDAISKMPGVEKCTVNFMMQKMTSATMMRLRHLICFLFMGDGPLGAELL